MKLYFKNKTKPECREFAKEIRNNLDISSISKAICTNLADEDFYKFSKNILSFYPFSREIDLTELYKDETKSWCLPRVEMITRSLIIHRYHHGDFLVKSGWGVFEPSDDQEIVDPTSIDVAIIPALMADQDGYRLGYGAGFYDRFIPGLRSDCIKIVPVPEELFVKSLPHDHWDVQVSKVVTQNCINNL